MAVLGMGDVNRDIASKILRIEFMAEVIVLAVLWVASLDVEIAHWIVYASVAVFTDRVQVEC